MRWAPYRHVVFDCDSTLTLVEGIDVLAEIAGMADEVARLTDAAMAGDVELEDVYGERLAMIRPTAAQIVAVRHHYTQSPVPDAGEVVSGLLDLGHEVYIVSGGLEEPVTEFGISLGVPESHIRAVGVEYDQLAGRWWAQHQGDERYLDYSRGALAMSEGKAEIIGELIGESPGRRLLVGDGVSDLLASESVDLFIGFGGVAARPKVRQGAPVFLTECSLSPILPLATGPVPIERLAGAENLLARGVALATAATWNDQELQTAFLAASGR